MPQTSWAARSLRTAVVLCLLLVMSVLPTDALREPGTPSVSGAAASPLGVVAEALTCANGFGPSRHPARNAALEGIALTPAGAWSVGFERRRDAIRRPLLIRNRLGGWRDVRVVTSGTEDGLVAVAASGDDHAWAVGFTTPGDASRPLAMRWNGRSWKVDRPPAPSALSSILTDVTLTGDGQPWAVGYHMTASGRHLPIAVRRDRHGWRYLNPGVGRRESITLTGIASDANGGFWAVGHGGPGTFIGPMVYRRSGGRWHRLKVPVLRGEGVLTDVVAGGSKDAWAVGYQRQAGRSEPLILRWDGGGWSPAPAPAFGSDEVILTAVSVAPTGAVWVVGTRWNEDLNSYEAVAAWWDGQAWSAVAGLEGGTELYDVAGDPDADGWAVGRSGADARATKVCGRPQAGLFGVGEPSEPVGPGTPDTAGSPSVLDRPTSSRGQNAKAPAKSSTSLLARRSGRRHGRRSPPRPRANPAIVARNVARQAGLAGATPTYDAIATDFDGDGRDDLYLGLHGRSARLALNRGGRFVDHEPMAFPRVDRHGCTALDIDGSGLPDLYCALGAARGSSLKANELWIDPGGPAPTDVAAAAGVQDAAGRGRLTAFLRDGQDGPIDLVVTNAPVRVDGLPSLGRRFRTDGDGSFVARLRPGFAARLGALELSRADYDRDGREDLLLVTGGLDAPRAEGTRLYRNAAAGLVDVTRRTGIHSFAEVDAQLVDLDRDGRLDLVQLSPTRLRISLMRQGRFRRVYEQVLTRGRAVAYGDVDGDHRPDLYIVRGYHAGNPPDLMLLNRGDGRSYRSMRIPQVHAGNGDDAVAIDHDENGLTDFLVLNGRNGRGPLELIAFYRRKGARAR